MCVLETCSENICRRYTLLNQNRKQQFHDSKKKKNNCHIYIIIEKQELKYNNLKIQTYIITKIYKT